MKVQNSSTSGFNSALRSCRVEAGLTQVQLARITGVSAPRLCILEGGGARPSKQVAKRIAAAMGLPAEKVFPDFSALRSLNRVSAGAA